MVVRNKVYPRLDVEAGSPSEAKKKHMGREGHSGTGHDALSSNVLGDVDIPWRAARQNVSVVGR
jgi:hypothetical protein